MADKAVKHKVPLFTAILIFTAIFLLQQREVQLLNT